MHLVEIGVGGYLSVAVRLRSKNKRFKFPLREQSSKKEMFFFQCEANVKEPAENVVQSNRNRELEASHLG